MPIEHLYLITINNTANYYVLLNPDHIGGVRAHLTTLASAVNATTEIREVHLSNLVEISENHLTPPQPVAPPAGPPAATPAVPEAPAETAPPAG